MSNEQRIVVEKLSVLFVQLIECKHSNQDNQFLHWKRLHLQKVLDNNNGKLSDTDVKVLAREAVDDIIKYPFDKKQQKVNTVCSAFLEWLHQNEEEDKGSQLQSLHDATQESSTSRQIGSFFEMPVKSKHSETPIFRHWMRRQRKATAQEDVLTDLEALCASAPMIPIMNKNGEVIRWTRDFTRINPNMPGSVPLTPKMADVILTIKLNVSGVSFATCRKVLRSEPCSVFARLMRNTCTLTASKRGTIHYLFTDPQVFKEILSYLITGKVAKGLCKRMVTKLVEESAIFNLHGLIAKIQTQYRIGKIDIKYEEKEWVKSQLTVVHPVPGHLVILSPDGEAHINHLNTVMQMQREAGNKIDAGESSIFESLD